MQVMHDSTAKPVSLLIHFNYQSSGQLSQRIMKKGDKENDKNRQTKQNKTNQV